MVLTQLNPHKSDHNRIIGLDIIRASAISFVMLFHATPLLQPLTTHKIYEKIILVYIKTLLWLGPIAVDLFFVLSGFLIGRILIRIFITTDKFKLNVVWEFWIKRWFRTLPSYLFLLTVAFILYFILYNNAIDWRYFFFVQNLAHQMPNFFGETWSLSIEEWTYLLLPMALLLAAAVFNQSDKKVILKYSIIIYIVIAVGIRFFKVYQQNYHDVDEEIRKITIYRLDAIIYGVLTAYIIQYYQNIVYKFRKVLLYTGLIGITVTLLFTFLCLHLPETYYPGSLLKIMLDTFSFSLIPLFFSLTPPASYFFKNMRETIFKKSITLISLISYSLYLIHNTLIFIPFFKPLVHLKSNMLILLSYFGFILVCIILSTINYYYFEQPTTRLRNLYIQNRHKKILRIKVKG